MRMGGIECPNPNDQKKSSDDTHDPRYDLAERTAVFGEDILRFGRTLRLDAISTPLVTQLVRSATSVGANYCEADEAGTRKEFRYRISVCKREIRETKHWLRMIAVGMSESL